MVTKIFFRPLEFRDSQEETHFGPAFNTVAELRQNAGWKGLIMEFHVEKGTIIPIKLHKLCSAKDN